MIRKPCLFAEEERGSVKGWRAARRPEQHVDFAAMAEESSTALPLPSRAKDVWRPNPTALMTKILIRQQFCYFGGDVPECGPLHRRRLVQFLVIAERRTIDHARTIWQHRDSLAQSDLGNKSFDRVQQRLLAYWVLGALSPDHRCIFGAGPVHRN